MTVCRHATCARLRKASNSAIPRQLPTLPIGLSNSCIPISSSPYSHLLLEYSSPCQQIHGPAQQMGGGIPHQREERCGKHTPTVSTNHAHSARPADRACLHGPGARVHGTGYFEKYCLDTGIPHEFATSNAPQHNGVSERGGRTIANIARCLLKYARFPTSLWGYCFSRQHTWPTACRTPRSKHEPRS